MGRLDDKVAIVTGAASGIGLETSIAFVRAGACVVLADINEETGNAAISSLQELVQSLKMPEKRRFIFRKCNVSKEEEMKALIRTAIKEFGKLNIMFNNAGVMLDDDGDLFTITSEIWDRTMDINVKGVLYGCRHAIPEMRKIGGGSIINTASFVAKMGAATAQLAYTASKGAVLAMTRELAILHAREGIRINALCPGPLRTPLLMDFLDTKEKRERRLVHIPMGRFGEAREIAQAALFLASDESSFITGTDFLVDGGITAAYVTSEDVTTHAVPFDY